MDKMTKFLAITISTYFFISWLVLTDRASYSVLRWIVSFALPLSISVFAGCVSKSLDADASFLAFVVGLVVTAANVSFSVCMIAFFITSSRLTKWRKQEKLKFEPHTNSGEGRNWVQVFCNGVVACMVSILYLHSHRMGESHVSSDYYITLTSLAYVSSMACCCGDTWASEIGSVLGNSPRLITTLRQVPKGTNGGVSVLGLIASAMGGLFIGTVFLTTQWLLLGDAATPQWPVLPLATAAGLVGSMIDSLLGATLQFSGVDKNGHISHSPGIDIKHISGFNILSNNSVNFVSSLIVTILLPFLTIQFFID